MKLNSEEINNKLNKIPFALLMIGYCGYLAFDYYEFVQEDGSDRGVLSHEVKQVQESNVRLDKRVRDLELFVKTLEEKKSKLRQSAIEFQKVSESMSDHLNTPGFMKMLITEAKRVGLKVQSLKPAGAVEKEVYLESSFSISCSGFFFQILKFLNRLANVKEVIRVVDLKIKPIPPQTANFVVLQAEVTIKTYTYSNEKANQMVKNLTASDQKQPSPGSK
ncbi:MAG: type 4a pilus biogenesis protein PilO [Bdellovibrionia bacterium]